MSQGIREAEERSGKALRPPDAAENNRQSEGQQQRTRSTRAELALRHMPSSSRNHVWANTHSMAAAAQQAPCHSKQH